MSPEVVVHFDPTTLVSGPLGPLSFDVTCTSTDIEGKRLLVTDGDDTLAAFEDIDADYNIRGEGSAARWEGVDALEVRVTIGEAR